MAGNVETKARVGRLRRLYDVCMEWVSGKYGVWALFLIAFVESSFFPIPPDVFLIAMCVAAPALSFRYAAVCSLASVMGGVMGYALGFWFMDGLGMPIIEWYGLGEKYLLVQEYFKKYDIWILGTAGFTPIPYKLFTITAGFIQSNFISFVVVSLVARSARFFLVAALIYRYGPSIQRFIDRYFNLLTIAFIALLAAGFVVVKLVL